MPDVNITRVVSEQDDGTWAWTVWADDGIGLTAVGEGTAATEDETHAAANAVTYP
jgi:hypothetical protein